MVLCSIHEPSCALPPCYLEPMTLLTTVTESPTSKSDAIWCSFGLIPALLLKGLVRVRGSRTFMKRGNLVKRLHRLSSVPRNAPDFPHLKRYKGIVLLSRTQKHAPSSSHFFLKRRNSWRKMARMKKGTPQKLMLLRENLKMWEDSDWWMAGYIVLHLWPSGEAKTDVV